MHQEKSHEWFMLNHENQGALVDETADLVRTMLDKVRWSEGSRHEIPQDPRPEPSPRVPEVPVDPELEFDFDAALEALQSMMDSSVPSTPRPRGASREVSMDVERSPVPIAEPAEDNPFAE